MKFHIDTHKFKDAPVVEVWADDGEFVAAIYSHGDGLKIVSKYLDGVTHESGTPPSLVVGFSLPTATHEGGSLS